MIPPLLGVDGSARAWIWGRICCPRWRSAASPPNGMCVARSTPGGHPLDRAVLRSAFGVLGPTEAGCGDGRVRDRVLLTRGGVLAVSGAAFTAVVLGQCGNGFACRSTRQHPAALGWTTNRLLVWAVAVSRSARPIPWRRAHGAAASPCATAVGWLLASTAALAVLVIDALDKRWRYRRLGQLAVGDVPEAVRSSAT